MKRAYNSCPKCGFKLSWRERVRLCPAVMRRVIPCPSCGVMLSWPKGSHRLMMVGTLFLLLLAAWVIPSRLESVGWMLSLLVPLALVVVGALGLRVEVHESSELKHDVV